VPTAAAIANAVADAVGVRFFELPLTAERVYWKLRDGQVKKGQRDEREDHRRYRRGRLFGFRGEDVSEE
jgi:hypothetical protein